ncbi:hypothetical protein SNEBB_005811 [Seison nebaliae]|nr:hypothetical protein SNEBB_005811 [Seison nebaliae]
MSFENINPIFTDYNVNNFPLFSIVWHKSNGSPWWPSIVAHVSGEHNAVHLFTLGKSAEGEWTSCSRLIPFDGLEEFKTFAQKKVNSGKDKDSKQELAKQYQLKVATSKRNSWDVAMKQAMKLREMNNSERMDFFQVNILQGRSFNDYKPPILHNIEILSVPEGIHRNRLMRDHEADEAAKHALDDKSNIRREDNYHISHVDDNRGKYEKFNRPYNDQHHMHHHPHNHQLQLQQQQHHHPSNSQQHHITPVNKSNDASYTTSAGADPHLVERYEYAVQHVKQGLSVEEASNKYRVSISALRRCIEVGNVANEAPRGRGTRLSEEEELKLVEWLLSKPDLKYNDAIKRINHKVCKLFERSHRNNPFKNGKPSMDWWYDFLSRHPQVLASKPDWFMRGKVNDQYIEDVQSGRLKCTKFRRAILSAIQYIKTLTSTTATTSSSVIPPGNNRTNDSPTERVNRMVESGGNNYGTNEMGMTDIKLSRKSYHPMEPNIYPNESNERPAHATYTAEYLQYPEESCSSSQIPQQPSQRVTTTSQHFPPGDDTPSQTEFIDSKHTTRNYERYEDTSQQYHPSQQQQQFEEEDNDAPPHKFMKRE